MTVVCASRTTWCGDMAVGTTGMRGGDAVKTRMPVRLAYAAFTLAGMTVMASCAKKHAAETAMDTGTTGAMSSSGSMDTSRPRAMAQPDAQMQAVLDQLQALDPKPLPTLTAAEERKQP